MIVFEPFRLDTANLCLWRQDERIQLTPKAFDVLRYVVERAGRLVTQDEILEALWPQIYVNREAIRKYILEIRKALGDRRNQPLFIETLPKRGYRFIAKVASEGNSRGSDALTGAGVHIGRPDLTPPQVENSYERGANSLRQTILMTDEPTLLDMFRRQGGEQTTLLLAIRRCIERLQGAPICQAEQVSAIVILCDLGRRSVSTWIFNDMLSNVAALAVPTVQEFSAKKGNDRNDEERVEEVCPTTGGAAGRAGKADTQSRRDCYRKESRRVR